MKTRLFSFWLASMLAVLTFAGCQAAGKAEAAEGSVKQDAAYVSDAPKQAVKTTAATASGKPASPALTLEEAQSIALKHAGLTADQVTALRTEYETEHGIPQYDVEFHHGIWEYDYESHADTGEILSFRKDD